MNDQAGRTRYLAERAVDLAVRVARLTRDLTRVSHRLNEAEAELAQARQTIAELGSHLAAALVLAEDRCVQVK